MMAVDQVYDVIWPSYRMALIPDELQGRVTSAYRMIFSSMGPVGAALSGILIQQIGAAGALLALGAGLCVVSVAVMLNPHVRHAPPIEKL
jgi:MFS family permease